MTTPQLNDKVTTLKNKNHTFSKVLSSVLLFVSILLFFLARWYIEKFGDTGFDSILFTIFSNTGGAQTNELIRSFLIRGLLPTVISYFVVEYVLFFIPSTKKLKLNIFPLKHWCAVAISLILSCVLLFSASHVSGLNSYIHGMVSMSTIFEDEYVDPDKTKIEFPEKKRNLIYIFL